MRDGQPSVSQDILIQDLAGTLTPVRRLASPLRRTLTWSLLVIALGALAAPLADVPALQRRLAATPDLWLAAAGSALTALTAALAAFQLSLPDRSWRWALLPLPFALLWIGASGIGCLRFVPVAGVREPTVLDARDCLLIVLGFSIPLSASLLAMLRSGYSLDPDLTALLGGLAASSAAATLLLFFHPFDAVLGDLVVHAFGVAIVIAAVRWIGSRQLRSENIRGGA